MFGRYIFGLDVLLSIIFENKYFSYLLSLEWNFFTDIKSVRLPKLISNENFQKNFTLVFEKNKTWKMKAMKNEKCRFSKHEFPMKKFLIILRGCLYRVSCKKVYPTLKVNTQHFLSTKTSKIYKYNTLTSAILMITSFFY